MQKEIGSDFAISPYINLKVSRQLNIDEFSLIGTDDVFLSTGRSAETLVIRNIIEKNHNLKKIALIPPFTCETVIKPLLSFGFKINAYMIDENLNMDIYSFEEQLEKIGADIVIVHRYFGFDTLKGLKEVIKKYSKQGVIFIEDKTQCLYCSFEDLGCDYVISSLRKWTEIPDGGIAVSRRGLISYKPNVYNEELERRKIDAAYKKYRYLYEEEDNKREFLEEFQAAERILDTTEEIYLISPASMAIQEKLDIKKLKEKRRTNYSYLYYALQEKRFLRIIMPNIGENDVPLYFAISITEREFLRNYLKKYNIYAPIVWPKAKTCPIICNQAQEIYDSILCIPIDQRYDETDMQRICDCIMEYGAIYC